MLKKLPTAENSARDNQFLKKEITQNEASKK
jgi:hypothetical protein